MATIDELKKLIPRPLKNIIRRGVDSFNWDEWSTRSWAQEGEDMVLRRIFGLRRDGFYVDVGAHHPRRFSNTYYFYRRGWRGINIDPMPGSMALFKKLRPRDTNLEIGIAQQEGQLNYYEFNDLALNSFSEELSRERCRVSRQYRIERVTKVNVLPLRNVFRNHLHKSCIDFLNVDVEGFDLEVLQSNDWLRYRPNYVLVEILISSWHSLSEDQLVKYMGEQGYVVFAKTMNTVFFRDAVESWLD